MSSFAILFSAALLTGMLLRLWLSARQARAIVQHRGRVPAAFAEQVSLADHQKAADYSLASIRLGRLAIGLDALVTAAFTVGGGIGWIDQEARQLHWAQPWQGTLVVMVVVGLMALLDLPLTLYRTFGIEARFGFNRITVRLFLLDVAKSALLALLIGGPVVLAALLLMDRAGRLWWLWAWGGWLALMLLMTWAWPAFIAPWFNRFVPLQDRLLRGRIESLLERCGFRSQGVFVVDGSRRSSHGNAYFTGIGQHKRIVFFDTLLERLTHAEIEAVLAHELGHFRLHHVRSRLLLGVAGSLAGLAVLGWLAAQSEFYRAFGSIASSESALLLFALGAPVFTFFATPVSALWSRRHEFQADRFAARQADATELAGALVKLYRDNASTLTPDPLYSSFYYSHPPARERIARLRSTAAADELSRHPAQAV